MRVSLLILRLREVSSLSMGNYIQFGRSHESDFHGITWFGSKICHRSVTCVTCDTCVVVCDMILLFSLTLCSFSYSPFFLLIILFLWIILSQTPQLSLGNYVTICTRHGKACLSCSGKSWETRITIYTTMTTLLLSSHLVSSLISFTNSIPCSGCIKAVSDSYKHTEQTCYGPAT